MKSIICIPALNPPYQLYDLVKEILELDPEREIIIFNDGSDDKFKSYFKRIKDDFPATVYLEHDKNLGKGKTIKDFIEFVQTNRSGAGIVTADSDGQHSPKDILTIAQALDENCADMILGVRNFSNSDVPSRSKFGNKLTSFIFSFCLDIKLQDTQTGLRGISANIMNVVKKIKSDRYEFETEMLLAVYKNDFSVSQIPISTIYIDNNSESHFNPIKDSFKIYSVLIKAMLKQFGAFIFSSFISAAVDFSLFCLLFSALKDKCGRLFWSVMISRAISLLFNYILNRMLVFQTKRKISSSFLYYLSLACIVFLCSYSFTKVGIYMLPEVPAFCIKLVVDTLLFIFSYMVQKKFIFKRRTAMNE